jgi:two-component system, response regulator YesN
MFNNSKHKTHKKLYPKILFSFTISITLAIILLSTMLYFSFENIILQITDSFVKDNLTQVSYCGTLMNKTAYSILMQMNVDNDINRLLYDYVPESEELTSAQSRLFSYVSANPFVQSVYVYNGMSNTFYDSGKNIWSRDDFYDKEMIYILDNFQKYLVLSPIPRVINNNTLNSGAGIQTNVYTYVFYDKQMNTSDNKLDKAVAVNINEKFIKDMIDTMSSNKSSEIYIINSTGILLQTNTYAKMLSNINDRPFIQKIIKDTKPQGSFIETVDNGKYLVSFISSSVLDWKFICMTPYEFVMDRVNYMKSKVMLICGILLSIGILASFLLSKRINSPISSMQDNLKTLKIEQLSNLKLQKQVYMKSILQSGTDSNMENTLQTFKLYNIKIDSLDNYLVMVLKIDHYFDFCNKYNLSDRNLMKFAVMNVASEICEAHFKNEALDLGDDHVVMIMNASDSHDDSKLLEDISTLIIESILKNLDMSVSISVSTISKDLSDLNKKYNEALETSQYRVYSGCNSILTYHDIIEKHSKTFSYPIQKENMLIDALMLGNIEEVQYIFNEILDITKNYSYKSFILTLTRMATAIQIAVDNFEKNSNFHMGYDFSRFTLEFSKLEFLDDIRNYFFSLFEYIYEKLLERKDAKYDELITRVIEIINNNYHDMNLSLESIADMLGISASYLGKLFKKFTSNTISDYITQIRLEASKKLLASTDYSIDKITEKIGLTYSNYFYKVFKKTYGITPNEYKKNISLQKNKTI